MIYARSIIVGSLSCMLWSLLMYGITEGKIVEYIDDGYATFKILLGALGLSAAMSNWAIDIFLPREPRTGMIVGISVDSIVGRLMIAAFAAVMFAGMVAYFGGRLSAAPALLFSMIGASAMVSVYASCQILHRLGPPRILIG